MKRCARCHEDQPLTDFYSDKRAADGKRPDCKRCFLKSCQVYKQSHKAAAAVRDREWRQQNRARINSQAKDWQSRNPGNRAGILRKWRQANPDKNRAQNRLNKAVRTGKIVRSASCQSCGKACRVEGHHADYAKPLEVQWLCRRCHSHVHWLALQEASDEN